MIREAEEDYRAHTQTQTDKQSDLVMIKIVTCLLCRYHLSGICPEYQLLNQLLLDEGIVMMMMIKVCSAYIHLAIV